MLHRLSALSISLALGVTGIGGLGAVPVPEKTGGVEQPMAAWATGAPLTGRDSRGPDQPTLFAAAASRSAQNALAALSGLSPAELRMLAEDGAGRLRALLRDPPAAAVVANWWNPLDGERKTLLHDAVPELVGNLDGIPVADRDRANRLVLARAIAAAEAELPGLGRGQAFRALDLGHMLGEIRRALEVPPGEAPRRLLLLDTAGQGRAAISIGELETARFVSLLIPGMFFTVEGQLYDWTAIAQELQRDQLALLRRSGGGSLSGGVATVAWIGYQTPHLFTIASLGQAVEGADALVRTLDGLRAIRDDDPYLSLVAHSYGSTMAMIALQKHTGRPGLHDAAINSLGVDAVAMLGSPGGTAAGVGELGVDPAAVFVGTAAGDPIARIGFYGTSPADPVYGASPLAVDEGVDSSTGAVLQGAFGHLDYFLPGSQALRSIALVTLGLGQFAGAGPVSASSLTTGAG